MDINMPVMDGVEASRIIQQMVLNGHVAPVPVVAVTAAEETSAVMNRLREVGIDIMVQKPMTKEKFMQVAQRYLLN